ncbi:MAG: hypothetical protein IT275_11660, partial [Chitinophagales bacterium]|nr:hypothetical protein [Chitinophagales bacterium]
MFAEAYIKTASEIIDVYKPQLPLAVFLKQYFRLNKKFGSRDRKIITSLLYGYFRLGVQPEYITRRMHIILGSFLSGELPILFYQKTCNEVCAYYSLSFDDKRSFVEKKYHVRFSLPYKLSEGVNEDDYFRYLFRPANVFIRIRKNQSAIIQKLLNSNIPFKQISSTCLAFNQNIKLNEILGETDEYVIQDYSSQLTATLFPSIQTGAWWDCCAASGGKSLLLFDHNQHIQLDISDIRKSIIEQLKYRLHQYHFQPNKIFIHDARQALKGNKKYHSV